MKAVGQRVCGWWGVIGLALCGGLGGCADPLAVFQERPEDLARRLPVEQVSGAAGLDVERFKKPPAPPESLTPEALAQRAAGAGTPSGADSTVEWSLDQVRRSALAGNLDLRVSLVDPAIARQTEAAERAKFDAVFRPSLETFKTDRPSTNSTSVTQVRGTSATAALDIPLRTGGTLTMEGIGSYSQADNPFVTVGDSYNLTFRPSISLPLLRGSGREVNTASIKIAGYRADIAAAGTRLQAVGVLAEAERTYWRLVAARQELEVRKKQFELARVQLDRARRKSDAGDVAPIEVTRAQSGVASRVEAVINAETSLLIQQRALKRLANDAALPVDGDALVIPTTPPDLAEYALPAADLLVLAEQNRAELMQSERQLLIDALEINLASDATRPVLNLLASYAFDSARDRFNDSVHQLIRHQFQSYSARIEGQVPLSNDAAEAGLRRAVLLRVQTLATQETRRQTVRQEVLDTLDRVNSAWQRIIAAQQASILAGRTFDAENRQFDKGSRTSTDVLDAAADLADAQSAEVRAVSDYRIALVDLAVATGTVLGSAAVTWEEVPAPPLSGDRWRGLRPAGEPPATEPQP